MFRQLNKVCWPYKKMLGWALIALGALLLLIFVPFYIWLAMLGLLFVLIGILLAKC